MKIRVESNVVCGNKLYYPMCATSRLLSMLGRRKVTKKNFALTFTEDDLNILKQLGYEIEETQKFWEVKE